MVDEITFEPFPKIPRLKRGCIITEKLDGTNAQIIITNDGKIGAASRRRLITPDSDNYGFASWVEKHKKELLSLGPGRHFGEWWGLGIQRGYNLSERRFSLFNTNRWLKDPNKPACCGVVPLLYEGEFSTLIIDEIIQSLKDSGSSEVEFPDPEGIVVFLPQARAMFKVLCENDHKHKKELEKCPISET